MATKLPPCLRLPYITWAPGAISLLGNGTKVGTCAEYRGRGIAQALKIVAWRTARRYGAKYLRTANDSMNAPMLAINRKMGYKPEPGRYLNLKTLD